MGHGDRGPDPRRAAQTKRLVVNPGQRLSYQRHQKRAEHWVVVQGTAHVTLDDVVHEVPAGQAVEIPLQAKHRVENRGSEPLVFVEVQTGTYFGEDDIERFDDDYGRVS
jgi:mannose-6-phosphate isomerase-like protein (cupin superfamily)